MLTEYGLSMLLWLAGVVVMVAGVIQVVRVDKGHLVWLGGCGLGGWLLSCQLAHGALPNQNVPDAWFGFLVQCVHLFYQYRGIFFYVVAGCCIAGVVIALLQGIHAGFTVRREATAERQPMGAVIFGLLALVAIFVGTFMLYQGGSTGSNTKSSKTELVKLAERAEKFQKAYPKYKLNPQVSPFYIHLPADLILRTTDSKQKMADKVDASLSKQTGGEVSAAVTEIKSVEIQGTKDNRQIEFYVIHYTGVVTTNGVPGKEGVHRTIVPITLTEQEVEEMAKDIALGMDLPNEGTRPSDAPTVNASGEPAAPQRSGHRLILKRDPNFKPEK
jgi:hypothetical protein